MKKLNFFKRTVALFMAIILATGTFAIRIIANEDVTGYVLLFGDDTTATPPAELMPGQVWTGKSVVHHRDHTTFPGDWEEYPEDSGEYRPIRARATVTLYAWGNTFWQEPLDSFSAAMMAFGADFVDFGLDTTDLDTTEGETPTDEASLASLVVEKTVATDYNTSYAMPGEALNYTISIHNAGDGPGTDIAVQDDLTYLLPYIYAPMGDVIVTGADMSISIEDLMEGIVIGEIAPGETVTLAFSVIVYSGLATDEATELVNVVTVNDTQETVTIYTEALEMTAPPAETPPGEEPPAETPPAEEPPAEEPPAEEPPSEEPPAEEPPAEEPPAEEPPAEEPPPTEDPVLYAAYEDDYGFFSPFAEEGMQEFPPLDLDHPYIVITDTLGEFSIDPLSFRFHDGSVPGGTPITPTSHTGAMDEDSPQMPTYYDPGAWTVSIGDTGDIVWRVHQDIFAGMETYGTLRDAPVSISFDIYLDKEPFALDHTYESGPARSVRYYPNMDNRLYWEWLTYNYNALAIDAVNWNNGNGLKSVQFRDLEFGVTFTAADIAVMSGVAYDEPGAMWFPVTLRYTGTTTAYPGGPYAIHMQWTKGGLAGVYDRYFTIRNFPEPGMYTTYQFTLDNPGGNNPGAGYRIITDTELHRVEYYPDNPDSPIHWDGNAIIGVMDARAEITFHETPDVVGAILIKKQLESPDYPGFMEDWEVDDDTEYTVVIIMNPGPEQEYVRFTQPDSGRPYLYQFFSTVSNIEDATLVGFSVNRPALVINMPTSATYTAESTTYSLKELGLLDTELIVTSFIFNEGDHFFVEPIEDEGDMDDEDFATGVTVVNTYHHGIGNLLVSKMLDGALTPDSYTETFYFRVWDVAAENYLLFKNTPQGEFEPFPGSFWCVGNQELGFTEPVGTDVGIMMEIPFSFANPALLSNLWTWGDYEVREVRRLGDASVMNEMWDEWRASAPTLPFFEDEAWTEIFSIQDFFGTVDGDTGWFGLWEYIEKIQNPDRSDFHIDPDWDWGVISQGNNQSVPFLSTHEVILTNVFQYEAGQMIIYKTLSGAYEDWGIRETTIFHAQLFNDRGQDGDADMLLFERMQIGFGPVSWRNVGYIPFGDTQPVFYEAFDQERYEEGATFTTDIPFSVIESSAPTAPGPAHIIGLPIGAGNYYVVREFFPDGSISQLRNSTITVNSAPYPVHGVHADATRPLIVIINNDFELGDGEVVFTKFLSDFWDTWEGIDNNTLFYLALTAEAPEGYMGSPVPTGPLTFSLADGRYVFDPAGSITHIPFSVLHPAILEGLYRDWIYTATEFIDDPLYGMVEAQDFFPPGMLTVSKDYNLDAWRAGEDNNLPISVTNTFAPGTGTFIVEKALVNPPSAVTNDTDFYVTIRDLGATTNLVFIPAYLHANNTLLGWGYTAADNVWWCVGNDEDDLSEHLPEGITMGHTLIEIPISVNAPATLLNMWAGTSYEVREIPGGETRADIDQHTDVIWHGEEATVVVTNTWTYLEMTVEKALEGLYADWGVSDNTIFEFEVYNHLDLLLFERITVGWDVTWRNVGFVPDGGVITNPTFYYPGDRANWLAHPEMFYTAIPFSINDHETSPLLPGPAHLTNLPTGTGTYYTIREITIAHPLEAHFTPTVFVGSEEMPVGGISAAAPGSFAVVIENDFFEGAPGIVLTKEVLGFGFTWQDPLTGEGIDETTVFYIQVTGQDDGVLKTFDLVGGEYEYNPGGTGAVEFIPISQTGAHSTAILTGLPATQGYDFEEFIRISTSPDEFTPALAFAPFNGALDIDFHMDHTWEDFIDGIVDSVAVTVANTFTPGTGTLTVEKVLVDEPASVDDDTEFLITVKDVGFTTNLVFIPAYLHANNELLGWGFTEDDFNNTWWCVGNDEDGLSEHLPPGIFMEDTVIEIPISVNGPAILLNLWAGTSYEVHEVSTGMSLSGIAQHTDVIWDGADITVVVTNTWTYFDVIYHANATLDSGSAPLADTGIQDGTTYTVLGNTGSMYRYGYDFMGWATSATGTVVYVEDDTFTMPAADVNLYAVWQHQSQYTVTYDGNGNTGGTAPADTNNPYYAEDEVTVLDEGDLVKSVSGVDHYFVGWSTNPSAAAPDPLFAPGATFVMPAEDITLYAVWVPADYFVVVYDGNGNDTGAAPVDALNPYKEGSTVIVLGQNTMAKDPIVVGAVEHEFTFEGWSFRSNAQMDDEDVFQPGEDFLIDEAPIRDGIVTLYAVWHDPEIYDGEALFMWNTTPSDDRVYAQDTYQHGAYVIPPTDPSTTGLIFIGWYWDQAATDMVDFDDVTMPGQGNLVFYAGWLTPEEDEMYHPITIIVVDEEDEPIEDAEVVVYDEGGNEIFRGRTGRDGRLVTRPLPDGNYTVEVEDDDYEPADPQEVTIAGEEEEVTFRLRKKPSGGTITVIVIDEDEDPIEDAEVIVYDEDGEEVYRGRTGRDGRVRTPWLPDGDYTVVVTHPDYQPIPPVIVEIDGEDVEVVVPMAKPGSPPPPPPIITVPGVPEVEEEPSRLPYIPYTPRDANFIFPHVEPPVIPLPIVAPRPRPIIPPPGQFFIDEHIWFVRGDTENNFRPEAFTSRADIAILFYRLLRPEWKAFDPDPNPFTDVVGDEWFGRAVGILYHYGIITGYYDGSYRPYEPITRREFAAVVSRFDNLEETNHNPYTDVSSSDWAYRYILSATARGWFQGHDGRFRPEDFLTRAEMVTAVNRILRRRIRLENLPPNVHRYADLDESHWAYEDIMEASHTHTYVRNEDGETELWIDILGTGLNAPYNE